VARLRQIPRVLSETSEVMRAGMRDKLMPVRFLLEKIPVQCEGIIEADPFLLPTKKYPEDISADEQQRLTQEITDEINKDVIPAYRTFAAFVRTVYAPQGRTTLAVTSLPDGEKRYENDIYGRTTTHMPAEEIHQLGLREIDRIEGEMTAIAKKEGFADLESFRAAIAKNPKYKPTSAEQILDDFRHYIAEMQPKLPVLFTLLPKSPVTVEAIPPFQAAAATHYVTGTPDGKRPGRVVWRHLILRTDRWWAMRRLLTTKGFRGITCSFRCSSSSPGCRNSGCMGWASTRTSKDGLCTRSSWGRKLDFIRTRFRITGGFRRNYFARCAW
jgi:uncharacterized protein (DUF885 family)